MDFIIFDRRNAHNPFGAGRNRGMVRCIGARMHRTDKLDEYGYDDSENSTPPLHGVKFKRHPQRQSSAQEEAESNRAEVHHGRQLPLRFVARRSTGNQPTRQSQWNPVQTHPSLLKRQVVRHYTMNMQKAFAQGKTLQLRRTTATRPWSIPLK